MNVNRDRVFSVLRAIVHEIRVERVTFMAGSIAYNAFLSLLPLLFLLLAVVAALGSTDLEHALITLTQTVITPAAGEILVSELQEASLGISLVGLLVLLWGALRIFRSLDMAFSDIYESQAENTLFNQLHDGIVVLVSLTVIVLLMVLVEARIDVQTGPTLGWVLQRAILFGVLCLALFPMFYLFPDEADMEPIEAVSGVVFAAFGLLLFQSLFGIYLEVSSPRAQNSLLASIIIFLVWLYFSALVLLIGGVINAVLTNRSGEVQIRPVIGPKVGASIERPESRGIPRTSLEELIDRLPTASSLEITVDGTTIELPPPDRVDADIDTSKLPFINNTAHIELHWTGADE